VFLTIYICTINMSLLFDNTTGMTHLKILFDIGSLKIAEYEKYCALKCDAL